MRWVFIAAAVALVGALLWWTPEVEVAKPHVDAVDVPAASNEVLVRAIAESRAAAPPSLKGAELDGEVSWYADGSVRLDLALRRRFDHLLSALGEVSLAQVRSRLETELTPSAPVAQVRAVMAVFDRYVAYLEAVGRLQAAAEPKKRLEQLHALRVEKLGAELARAFFDDEERADTWAVERAALVRDGQATPESLAKLDELLTPEARELIKDTQTLRDVVDETAKFDAEGLDAEARRKVREAKVGPEAAARLGELDDERAKWNARVEAFRVQKQSLDASELERVLERDFTEPERRRVRELVLEE